MDQIMTKTAEVIDRRNPDNQSNKSRKISFSPLRLILQKRKNQRLRLVRRNNPVALALAACRKLNLK